MIRRPPGTTRTDTRFPNTTRFRSEQLQANRSQMVHLFDSLVRTIPDGVVLTSIKQAGEKLTLEGRSQSNARVSTYMRSEEHTSELQSLMRISYAVFCLIKKNLTSYDILINRSNVTSDNICTQ